MFFIIISKSIAVDTLLVEDMPISLPSTELQSRKVFDDFEAGKVIIRSPVEYALAQYSAFSDMLKNVKITNYLENSMNVRSFVGSSFDVDLYPKIVRVYKIKNEAYVRRMFVMTQKVKKSDLILVAIGQGLTIYPCLGDNHTEEYAKFLTENAMNNAEKVKVGEFKKEYKNSSIVIKISENSGAYDISVDVVKKDKPNVKNWRTFCTFEPLLESFKLKAF